MNTIEREQIDRRTSLLEAGLRLIAREGMRALTHRAVENEAGVPHGSTTYYFGSRDDLIAALVNHMHDSDKQKVEPIAYQLTMLLADRSRQVNLADLVDALVGWFEANTESQLARYELQLAGSRDERIRELMTDCARTFWRMLEPVAIAAGSREPARDARTIHAVIDGLMFDWLTHIEPDRDRITDGIARILASYAAGDEVVPPAKAKTKSDADTKARAR